MNIAFLSAAFPPEADAIGEHTWWLARELRNLGHSVTILTTPGVRHAPDPGTRIVSCFDHARPVSHREIPVLVAHEHRRFHLDWLVIQYNPFAYGRRGFCPWIPVVLRSLRELQDRPRLAVMFHEIYTSDPGFHASLMRLWQRPQALDLASHADCVLASCGAYGHALRQAMWHLLPVGSNLPDPVPSVESPSNNPPILLGAFGTGHSSHRFDLMARTLREVRERGIDAGFLFIGSGGAAAQSFFQGLPFRASGSVPAEEAGRLLASLDCVLAPFTDGLSTRRGSVAAAFQHGRPVVSNRGANTDCLLKHEHENSLLLTPQDDDSAFVETVISLCRDSQRRQAIGLQARALYDRVFSWDRVARRLLDAFETHS